MSASLHSGQITKRCAFLPSAAPTLAAMDAALYEKQKQKMKLVFKIGNKKKEKEKRTGHYKVPYLTVEINRV